MPVTMDADMHPVQQALAAIRSGSFAIVVDDFDRENEGDLIGACSHATNSSIALMLRHTTGIICVAVTPRRAKELSLPLMVPHNNEDPFRTAFTVTIDYRHGTTTGVSASDRAATIRAVADVSTQPEDFTRPGHVFPLLAQDAGVLTRGGHTEATVDLVRLAGAGDSGYLCEIYEHASGEMVRLPGLRSLSRTLALPLVSIADIQRYRYRREVLVQLEAGESHAPPLASISSFLPIRTWHSRYGPTIYHVYRKPGEAGVGGKVAVWFRAAAALLHADRSSLCNGHASTFAACDASLLSFASAVQRAWQSDEGAAGTLILVEGAPWENVQGKEAAQISRLKGDGTTSSQAASRPSCEVCPLLPARPPGHGVPPSAHAGLYGAQGLEEGIRLAEAAAGVPCSVICDRVCAELGQVVRAEVCSEGSARAMYGGADGMEAEEVLYQAHKASWPSVQLAYVPGTGQPIPNLWQYGVRLAGLREAGVDGTSVTTTSGPSATQ